MYFSQTFNTKWHDTDAGAVVRPSAVLMYMQETGNRQCRAYGMDLNDLFFREGRGFILARLRLSLIRPLRAYEDIEVRTWCPPSRGVTFLRCFSILRDGETVAEAASSWAMVDANTHSFVRVSDLSCDFPTDAMIDSARLPRDVRMPQSTKPETVGTRQILRSDLDFNRHMNNTRYPDLVCDFLPEAPGRRVRAMSLSFVREAPFGDTLTMQRAPALLPDGTPTGGWLTRAVRGDGQVCFEAETTIAGEDE